MGPCRLMGGDRTRGVCGADADLMVARNLLEHLATGAAAHSDHGRDVVETLLKAATGEAPSYGIADEAKLLRSLKRISRKKSYPGKGPRMARRLHTQRPGGKSSVTAGVSCPRSGSKRSMSAHRSSTRRASVDQAM